MTDAAPVSWLAFARLAYQALRMQVTDPAFEWAQPGTDRAIGALKFECSFGARNAALDADESSIGEAERMIEVWTAVLEKTLKSNGNALDPRITAARAHACNRCGAIELEPCAPAHDGEREPGDWCHPERGMASVGDAEGSDRRAALAWARSCIERSGPDFPADRRAVHVARGVLELAADRQRFKEERFGMLGMVDGRFAQRLADRELQQRSQQMPPLQNVPLHSDGLPMRRVPRGDTSPWPWPLLDAAQVRRSMSLFGQYRTEDYPRPNNRETVARRIVDRARELGIDWRAFLRMHPDLNRRRDERTVEFSLPARTGRAPGAAIAEVITGMPMLGHGELVQLSNGRYRYTPVETDFADDGRLLLRVAAPHTGNVTITIAADGKLTASDGSDADYVNTVML